MNFIATSIQDYKAKIKAIETLDLKIIDVELFGYFSSEDEASYKENVDLAKWYNENHDSKSNPVYEDDNVYVNTWETIEKVSNKWITMKRETGETYNICFPRNPSKDSWKSEASILIKTQHKNK